MNVTTDNNISPSYATSAAFRGQGINQAARVMFATVGGMMVLCGVLGNALLIAVIFRHFQRKRYMHNLFVANLALADILTLGYWLTFFVLDLILGYHPVRNQAHCEVNGMAIGVLSVVSITTLLSISLNRFLHVCHSHLYVRLFTLPRTLLLCLLSWLLGFVLALPPVLGIGVGSYHYNHLTHICSFNRHKLSYSKVLVILFSTVPMVFIGYWNFAIFRFWKKARMNISSRYALVRKEDKKAGKRNARMERLREGKCHDAEVDQEEDGGKRVNCGPHNPQIMAECCPRSSGTGEKNNDREQFHNSGNSEITEDLSSSSDKIENYDIFCSQVSQQDDSLNDHNCYQDMAHSHASSTEFQDHGIKPEARECVGTVHDFHSAWKPCQIENSTYENRAVEGVKGEVEDEKVKGKTEDEIGEEDIRGKSRQKEHSDLGKCQANGIQKTAQDSRPKLPCKSAAGKDKEVVPKNCLSLMSSKPSDSPSSTLSFIKSNTISRHKHHITTAMENLQRQRKKQKTREVAFVRSLFVVFILMFVSFIPYGVSIIISSYVELPPEVLILGILLLFTNNAVNWVVYGLMARTFREGYKACLRQVLITCCRVGQLRAETFLSSSKSSLQTTSLQRLPTDNDLDTSVVSQPTSGVL